MQSFRRKDCSAMPITRFDPEKQDPVADVVLPGGLADYHVQLWLAGRDTQDHVTRDIWAYRLYVREPHQDVGRLIFEGEDLRTPTFHDDAADTIVTLLAFLSCHKGDVEPEYFEDYSPEQLDFAERFGEDLAMWGLDDDQTREEVRKLLEADDPA